MCTSFVSYYGKTIYGMNYDFKLSKSYATIKTNGHVNTFLLYSEAADKLYPQYMYNSNGLFVNIQNINNCSLRFWNTKSNSTVDYIDFINHLLFATSAEDAAELMRDKVLSFPYNFRVKIESLQSLIADKDGDAMVFDYDIKNTYITPMKHKHMILTNMAHCLERPEEDGIFKELYRYDTIDNYIETTKDKFDIEDGFKVLALTRNDLFSYTLVSSVIDVEQSDIFFCLNRNFDRVCKINVVSGKISLVKGYNSDFSVDLVNNLYLLDRLEQDINNNEAVFEQKTLLPG